MEWWQWLGTAVGAVLGILLGKLVDMRKQSWEEKRGDRSDTFTEYKTLLESERSERKSMQEQHDEERKELSDRLDAISREHLECQKKSAKLEAQIEHLMRVTDELRTRITELSNALAKKPRGVQP